MTWFKIYLSICKELGILYPLKQMDICVRKNPIPNTLEFHKKNIDKKQVSDDLDMISKVYYRIYRDIGSETFDAYLSSKDIFNSNCTEYSDRVLGLSTVLSVLVLSGFTNEVELYRRGLNYLKGVIDNSIY